MNIDCNIFIREEKNLGKLRKNLELIFKYYLINLLINYKFGSVYFLYN